MNIQDQISKLEQESQKKLAEAKKLTALQAEFPELKRHVGRWGKEAYYTKAANTKVTDFETRYNCGCCPDSPREIWPYLDTAVGRIYSDPPSFVVADRSYDLDGDIPHGGWDAKLRNAGIPEEIVKRVGLFMCTEEVDGDASTDQE